MFGRAGRRRMNKKSKDLKKYELRDVEKVLKKHGILVVKDEEDGTIYGFETDSRCRKNLSVAIHEDEKILLNRNDEKLSSDSLILDELEDLEPELVKEAL